METERTAEEIKALAITDKIIYGLFREYIKGGQKIPSSKDRNLSTKVDVILIYIGDIFIENEIPFDYSIHDSVLMDVIINLFKTGYQKATQIYFNYCESILQKEDNQTIKPQ